MATRASVAKSPPVPTRTPVAKPAPVAGRTPAAEIVPIAVLGPPPTLPAQAALTEALQAVDLGKALAGAFLTGERINQLLLDMVDPRVWRVFPMSSSRRNVAMSFAHIHNVRCSRIQACDKTAVAVMPLDRAIVSQDEVRWSLGGSARAMVALIERSVSRGGHVHGFGADIVVMVCAAIAHEAHHRGQIGHWLRELGTPLTPEQQLTLWEWDKRWKEIRR